MSGLLKEWRYRKVNLHQHSGLDYYVMYKMYTSYTRNIKEKADAISLRVEKKEFFGMEPRLYFYPQYFGPLHNRDNPKYKRETEAAVADIQDGAL